MNIHIVIITNYWLCNRPFYNYLYIPLSYDNKSATFKISESNTINNYAQFYIYKKAQNIELTTF